MSRHRRGLNLTTCVICEKVCAPAGHALPFDKRGKLVSCDAESWDFGRPSCEECYTRHAEGKLKEAS